jgi:hypothetical protein
MTRGRQETVALAAALGLHVAVLGFLYLTHSESSSSLEPPEPSRPTTWEVELAAVAEAETETAAATETAHDPVHEARHAEEAAAAHFVPRVNAGRSELEPLEPEAAVVVEGPREPEPEQEAARETAPPRPIQLGLGADGWQRWVSVPKAGDAPSADRTPARKNRFHVLRSQPKSTTGGLQEGLEERDRALGFGPQGRVLSALHQAAHSALAPDVGVARFEVTVHRSGIVEVALVSASGSGEQWKKVAGHIASDLRAKPPRIPPPREGAKFVLELTAEWTLPNGTKLSELEKAHLDVPPPNFQSTDDAKAQLQRENPTTTQTPSKEEDVAIKLDTPGVYVAQRGALGGFRAGLGTIAGGYRAGAGVGPTMQGTVDPSHLGAKPQRMVRAHVIAQSLF